MAKTLSDCFDSDIAEVRNKPMRRLSEQYFFRDPNRPVYSDTNDFFPPAGVIKLYVREIHTNEGIIDIKGKEYSLQTAGGYADSCNRDTAYYYAAVLTPGRPVRF